MRQNQTIADWVKPRRQGDGLKGIEELMEGLDCPKDLKCVKSGVRNLCKAKSIGVKDILECLEKSEEVSNRAEGLS